MKTRGTAVFEEGRKTIKRVLLVGSTMLLATLLLAPAAMAQSTPFDSQYAPPTAPPPPSECVEGDPASDPSGSSGCEEVQILPATGGLSSIPFSAFAPAALLGAGIIAATGIVAIRRRG